MKLHASVLLALAMVLAPCCISAQQGDLLAPAPQTAPPVIALPASTPQLAPAALSSDQLKQLMEKAAEHDDENDKRARDYTYIQREEERRLNGKGEVESTDSTTSEVLMLYGSEVDRLIAKNDKPLSPKDAAKEEEKIQKIIDKRKNETEAERAKRLKAEEKDHEESREWTKEIGDAFDFSLAGTEDLNGRPAYVIDGTPRPGFKPHLKYANYLTKFRFRVWLDAADLQLAKLNAECISTASWGWFLARLEKGAHILVEQTRVNDEVWLPRHQAIQLDARLALLKTFHVNMDTTFRDYKKFRTDAKVLGVSGEVPEPKPN
jgi:hypothetical protein